MRTSFGHLILEITLKLASAWFIARAANRDSQPTPEWSWNLGLSNMEAITEDPGAASQRLSNRPRPDV
jgi:hypothetical protein